MMHIHIEYDDFGEYVEAMEDLLFSDRIRPDQEGSVKTEKVICFHEKWDRRISGKGA